MMKSIYEIEYSELKSLVSGWGEPEYRATQIWQGLYKNFWSSLEEFSNLPKSIREKICSNFSLSSVIPEKSIISKDGGTIKTLLRLWDGYKIEAVLMRYEKRQTLCISTQVGCAMGCLFCATGQMGLKRNLSSGEIIEQVLYYARLLQNENKSVTNIVFMGMGEPFNNYEKTLSAIDRLNHSDGMNFGERRFTISTVGIVPIIRRFSEEKRQINLAISLHAANNTLRSELIPINEKYPLSELIIACREYTNITGRRITFEWALIHGKNDSVSDARQLGHLLNEMLCHVNIIPLNITDKYNGKASSINRVNAFRNELNLFKIPCTIRLRRGIDINAGCGQLASGKL